MENFFEMIYNIIINMKNNYKASKLNTILYSKQSLMYIIHKIKNDYLWLSEDDIKRLHIKFQKNIRKCSFNQV